MTEPVDAGAAAAPIRLSVGVRLLGDYQGSDSSEPRFLVRRRDGQVIELSRLLYLVTSAISKGAPEGGWNAAQVAGYAGTEFGRALTADNVRYLVDGKLAPLGITAADDLEPRPDDPESPPARNRTGRLAVAAGGVSVLAAAVAAVLVVTGTGTSTRSSTRPAARPAARPGTAAGNPEAVGTGPRAGSSALAAAWVAQQVSPDVTVSCDLRTCQEIQQAGFPADRLQPLTSSVRNPLRSTVVVATPAVRARFGAALAADYAPQVIASFGSGSAQVDVRTVAPDGAAAFRNQLAVQHAALVAAGRQLLRNRNVRPSPSARTALWAGMVDLRVLAVLAVLSHQMPVKLVAFTAATGTSADVPLRGAEISAAADQSAIISFLRAQRGPYQPAVLTVGIGSAGDAPLVALQFDAPSLP